MRSELMSRTDKSEFRKRIVHQKLSAYSCSSSDLLDSGRSAQAVLLLLISTKQCDLHIFPDEKHNNYTLLAFMKYVLYFFFLLKIYESTLNFLSILNHLNFKGHAQKQLLRSKKPNFRHTYMTNSYTGR